MSTLFLAVALSAALLYGISDYAGGRASARMPVVKVLVWGELFGAAVLWYLVVWSGEWPINTANVGMGIIAGITGAIGVALLYDGLSRGFTAMTAPLSAVLAAMIPAVYGIQSEGMPHTTSLIGMGIGLCAIVLTSMAGRINNFQGFWQGLGAGVAFGSFFVFLKYLGADDTIYTPLAITRTAALLVTLPWLMIRASGPATFVGIILALIAGGVDIAASAAYIMATQLGRLDVASVLASLYPAVTVILARIISKERTTLLQKIGVVASLIATTLIAL